MKISVSEIGIAEDGICAIDTNGNPLPIGEYEVELVWQYKGVLSDEWANETQNAYKVSYEEYSKRSKALGPKVETRQVYIASVAPESKQKTEPCMECLGNGTINGIHSYRTCHKCRGNGYINTNESEPQQLKEPAIDEAVSVEQMLREALSIQTKRAEDLLKERNEFREEIKLLHKQINQHTTALSVNNQPEKEVDTIEQAAEKHLMECPETGNEIMESFIAGANHKEQSFKYENEALYLRIDDLERLLASHVPIEEVERILEQGRITAMKSKSHSGDYAETLLYNLIEEMRNLIKPQNQ